MARAPYSIGGNIQPKLLEEDTPEEQAEAREILARDVVALIKEQRDAAIEQYVGNEGDVYPRQSHRISLNGRKTVSAISLTSRKDQQELIQLTHAYLCEAEISSVELRVVRPGDDYPYISWFTPRS